MKDELERMKSRLNRKILKFENKDKSLDKKIEDKNKDKDKENKEQIEAIKEQERKIADSKKELEKELERIKKELDYEKKKTNPNLKLKEELENAQKELEKERKEKEKLEEENNKAKIEEKEKTEKEKIRKHEEEFGPSGIGIYDRRSIIKEMRKKQQNEDNETFEKAFNPPAEVLSIRYKKLLKELLYALFFTIVIGTFHLLMFKEIEFPKIVSQGVIVGLALGAVFFFERSYRKDLDVKIFIRGIEFLFVASFLLYFTDKRYIDSKLVTLILPIISVCLIFYYIAKVIIIEKIERNKYIRSLSDVDTMINKNEKDEEIGMLYRKNINNKKLTYLLKVMDERHKKGPKKGEDKKDIKLNVENPYKKEKRTKKEQKKFNEWKAKVKS